MVHHRVRGGRQPNSASYVAGLRLSPDVERKLALYWPTRTDRTVARRVLALFGTLRHEREV
jgi:hypothetical protein